MQHFFDRVIKPYIVENGYRRLCEIGAEKGGNTDRLLSISPEISITVIDPCLDLDLEDKYSGNGRVRVVKGRSLDVLSALSFEFDCILIDGDHNWYTVYNEIKLIDNMGLLRPGGTIFLHDVGWPNGRRDMYYIPGSIPAEFRHSYEKKGIERGKSELSSTETFNSQYYNATHEGGPRNGVLTAVSDFLELTRGKYLFFTFDDEYGLGFLIRKGGIRTSLVCAEWLYRTKYYIFRDRIRDFLKRRYPSIYSCLARIKTLFAGR